MQLNILKLGKYSEEITAFLPSHYRQPGQVASEVEYWVR